MEKNEPSPKPSTSGISDSRSPSENALNKSKQTKSIRKGQTSNKVEKEIELMGQRIRRFETMTNFEIPRLCFSMAVADVFQAFPDYSIQNSALELLQEAAEYVLVDLFQKADERRSFLSKEENLTKLLRRTIH